MIGAEIVTEIAQETEIPVAIEAATDIINDRGQSVIVIEIVTEIVIVTATATVIQPKANSRRDQRLTLTLPLLQGSALLLPQQILSVTPA